MSWQLYYHNLDYYEHVSQKNNNQVLFLSIILHEKYLDSNSNIVINFPSLRNYNT